MGYAVEREDVSEFIGQIIDIFEDFLEAKGIDIQYQEKDPLRYCSIIHGSDYDDISRNLTKLMSNWGAIEKESDNMLYKIIHKEELVGYFYVEADSKEAALDEFNRKVNNGEIDFGDMEIIDSSDEAVLAEGD